LNVLFAASGRLYTMPTYDYQCKSCSHKFEHFQSIKAKSLRTCPACGKRTLERLIGIGAAIIFKGGGFYQTDYRSDAYKKAAEADKPASTATGEPSGKKDEGKEAPKQESKSETKPESKPESKSESKSESKPGFKPGPQAESKSAAASESKPASKSEAKGGKRATKTGS